MIAVVICGAGVELSKNTSPWKAVAVYRNKYNYANMVNRNAGHMFSQVSPAWVLGPRPGWRTAGRPAPATGTALLPGPPAGALCPGTVAANLAPWVEVVRKKKRRRVRMLFMRKPDSKLKATEAVEDEMTHQNKISVKEWHPWPCPKSMWMKCFHMWLHAYKHTEVET